MHVKYVCIMICMHLIIHIFNLLTVTGSLGYLVPWSLIADTVMVYSLLATILVPLSGNSLISTDDMLAGTVTLAGLYRSITVILYLTMYIEQEGTCIIHKDIPIYTCTYMHK